MWLSQLRCIPHYMSERCLNSTSVLYWTWRKSQTPRELFYSHPLGTLNIFLMCQYWPQSKAGEDCSQMQAGKGTASPLQKSNCGRERLSPSSPEEGGVRIKTDGKQVLEDWGAEIGSETSFKSFSHLFHSCNWRTQKANTQVQELQGWLWQLRWTVLSFLSQSITSGVPVYMAPSGWLFLLKAFKLIYFCSYPNLRIKQCSYLFACCSGHQQSYQQPPRAEKETLVTTQINHKNLLINALNYF